MNYYEILGIARTASADRIKAAFRSLARRYHPDVNDSSPEAHLAFRIIRSAYEMLIDDARRRLYDAYIDKSALFRADDSHIRKKQQNGRLMQLPDPTSVFATMKVYLNYLLWEIEDIISRSSEDGHDMADAAKMAFIENTLIQIDNKILIASGFSDHFYAARRIRHQDNRPMYMEYDLHRPYVNLKDYFYNIRKRAGLFFRRIRLQDAVLEKDADGFSISDKLFEIYDSVTQYIGSGQEL